MKICVKDEHIEGSTYLRIEELILSNPGADDLRELTKFASSVSVTGSRYKLKTALDCIKYFGLRSCSGILRAKVGPTFTKKSLNFSVTSFKSIVTVPSLNLNFDCSFFSINYIFNNIPHLLELVLF